MPALLVGEGGRGVAFAVTLRAAPPGVRRAPQPALRPGKPMAVLVTWTPAAALTEAASGPRLHDAAGAAFLGGHLRPLADELRSPKPLARFQPARRQGSTPRQSARAGL